MTDRRHLPALDGVRGLAIAGVLLVHTASFGTETAVAKLADLARSFGWAGVDLFFVLSGFLITGILLRTREQPNYYRAFYLRRIRRIVPLYAATVLVLLMLVPGDWLPWYLTWTVNVRVAMANNWAPAIGGTAYVWSLCVEEQFYLLWPFAVARWRRATVARGCLALAVIAFVCRVAAVRAGHPFAAYVLLPARMDGLAIGAWLALQGPAIGQMGGLAWRVLGLAGAGLAVIVGLTGYAGWDGPWMLTVGCSLTVLASGALVVLAVTRGLGRNVVLEYFGRRAYGLYMLGGLGVWLTDGWHSRLGTLAVTVLVAECSWRLIERPLLHDGLRPFKWMEPQITALP